MNRIAWKDIRRGDKKIEAILKNHPNILVVDDSAIIRKVLSQQLEQYGAHVMQAEDGQQGLQAALSCPFDLIISDVEMPHLDGFGLCESLKANQKTKGIPVVILSSLYTDDDIDRGFKVGAAAYISKADAQSQLSRTIEKVLEESRFHHTHTILVVEDSATIRSMVKKGLEEAGFQVITAENGKEAMQLLQQARPDLILSDIEMPEMNGIDLCRKLHDDPDLAAIPFVIMSTISDRATMRRIIQWGAASYLVKPFNLDQLIITIEKLLSDHFLILLKERERLDTEQRMMLASITSLIAALEARDLYTRGHSEEVARLVAEMARHMNASQEEIDSLGIAGRLHDLGKIGVPDSILLKPGRLSEEEFAVIKQHPVIGASILGSIPSIKPLLPVILHHHERYDGKGYPDGLKGVQIVLRARMTAVADTYHALVSDRPYRRGMDRDKAIGIIEEVRGTQLCPECVDVFKDMMKNMPVSHRQWTSEAEFHPLSSRGEIRDSLHLS